MMLDTARMIVKAEQQGELERSRTETGKTEHLRVKGSRTALCGKRTARSGGSTGTECRSCARMVSKANAAVT
jgi:hypothetical protein